MKTVSAVFMLAFCAGSGAFWHHLTEKAGKGGAPQRPVTQVTAPPATLTRATTVSVADALRRVEGPETRSALDERMAALKAGDFPLLFAELKPPGPVPKLEYPWKAPGVLMDYWAAANVSGLLEFAARHAADFDPVRLVHYCAPHDPAGALAFLRRAIAAGVPKDEQRRLWEKLIARAERHPSALLLAAEQSGALEQGRPFGLARTLTTWAEEDPAAAMALAQRHPELLQNALTGWAEKDVDAALAWVKQNRPGEDGADFREALLYAYAQSHPKEAERLRSLAANEEEFDRKAAEGLRETNPAEALGLMEKWKPREGDSFYNNFASTVARKTPTEAAALIAQMPEEYRAEAYGTVCAEMAYKDPARAMEFYTRLPELRGNAGSDHIFTRLALQNPAAAAQWMQPGKLPAEQRDRLMPAVMEEWLATDRAAALGFIHSLPADEVKGRVLLEASRLLYDGNAESQREYAMTLPDTAQRVGACRRILEKFGSDAGSPGEWKPEAAKWIAGISDAAVRKVLLTPPPAPPDEPAHDFGADPFATPDEQPAPSDPFASPENR